MPCEFGDEALYGGIQECGISFEEEKTVPDVSKIASWSQEMQPLLTEGSADPKTSTPTT